MVKGWIAIYERTGVLQVCPTLHATEDEVYSTLKGLLGNYRTNHLRAVCRPVYIEVEECASNS